MTWIVGAPTLKGDVFVVGDTQVTFASGVCVDCIQKVHRLGPEALFGFAGSVALGFRVFEVISERLGREAWPSTAEVAAGWLPREVRRVFASAAIDEARAGLAVLVAAPHPTRSAPPPLNFPFVEVYALRSPAFAVEKTRPPQIASIGSGARSYGAAIADVLDSAPFHRSGWTAQEQVVTLAATMRAHVESSPTVGVGSHFHVGSATRGYAGVQPFQIATQDHTTGATRAIEFPKFADTHASFLAFCHERGIAAAASEC